jgi:hypothetical protein
MVSTVVPKPDVCFWAIRVGGMEAATARIAATGRGPDEEQFRYAISRRCLFGSAPAPSLRLDRE